MNTVQFIAPSLKFVLMFGLEALAFACVTVYAFPRVRGGVSGVLGLVGGLLGVLSAGTFSAAWAQVQWAGSAAILQAMSEHVWLEHLDWVRAAAVALLAAALMTSGRSAAQTERGATRTSPWP